VPNPSRTHQQSGRIFHRAASRGVDGRAGGLVGIYIAICAADVPLCRVTANWSGAPAHSVLHGLQLVRCGRGAQAVWNMARAFWSRQNHHRDCAGPAGCLLMSIGRPVTQLAVLTAAALAGMAWCRQAGAEAAHLQLPIASAGAWRRAGTVRDLAVGAADIGVSVSTHSRRTRRYFLSIRRLGIWPGTRGPAIVARRNGAFWLDQRRSFSYRIRLRAGSTRAAFHIGSLSRRGHDLRALAWSACVAVIFIFLPGLLMTITALALWGRVCSP